MNDLELQLQARRIVECQMAIGHALQAAGVEPNAITAVALYQMSLAMFSGAPGVPWDSLRVMLDCASKGSL